MGKDSCDTQLRMLPPRKQNIIPLTIKNGLLDHTKGTVAQHPVSSHGPSKGIRTRQRDSDTSQNSSPASKNL